MANKKISVELPTENLSSQTLSVAFDINNVSYSVAKIGTTGRVIISGIIIDETQVDTLINQINKQ